MQNGRRQARRRRPRASCTRYFGFTRGGRLRDATHHYGAGDKRVDPHDCGPRRPADSRLKTGDLMTGNPDRSLTIDTHHHTLPDFFWQKTENAHAPVGGLAPLRWSKEASVSFMDDAAIDVAVVSVSTPGVHTGDSAKARALARRCNEFSAELVRSRPDRFGGFACLPLPDVDASLEELSYAQIG